MPFGDRTGPMGLGPMTGRAAGYCGGYDAPGYTNPIPGRGFGGRGFGGGGWGRGFGGRGWGWGRAGWSAPAWGTPYGVLPYDPSYAPAMRPREEARALKEQAEYFQGALEEINKRISELETSSAGE
jgi:hypothetical protein